MRLASVALVVREYDEAIAYFVDVLGFSLVEDTDLGCGKRWVRVAAPGGGSAMLLAKAIGDEQSSAIGRAGGGRVCYFLHTDDFRATYATLNDRGVDFLEEPRDEPYGWVVVFADLYGNRWDLVGSTPDAGIDGVSS
ncbi:VOC family protein [Sphingomonas sp. UV9]|uniref:VOC family protein n=1 Tax=Sphingomonas sp. UV9 TaxID=1851410 RepID=UPI000FFBF8CC|nr:VOC family protein [Sphingomonas sp. UV9]RXD03647.1 VOC family protein [Sphingomonas sp. UV9]